MENDSFSSGNAEKTPNFAFVFSLCYQLLALTIQHEKPDLEEQKTKLLQQEEDKKIQLAKLEDSLLEVKQIYLFSIFQTNKMLITFCV